MKKIDLYKFDIVRPRQVRWWFPSIAVGHAPWEYIQSKKLKKLLKNHENIVQSESLTWDFHLLQEVEYDDWIRYYETQFRKMKYDLLAKKSTFEKYSREEWEVYSLDLFQKGNLIGRKLVTIKEKEGISRFKVSAHDFRLGKCSIGAFIDYLMLLELNRDFQIQDISFGKSRNQFGVTNSLGYLEYKFHFGQFAKPVDDIEVFDYVELNQEGFVFFFGYNDQNTMSLYSIKPHYENERYSHIIKISPVPIVELTLSDE